MKRKINTTPDCCHFSTFLLSSLSFFLSCLMGHPANAQPKTTSLKYIDAHQLTILGRSAKIPPQGYNRVDTNLLSQLPTHVAELSKNTAGIQVNFTTNSTTIAFKWTLEKYGVIPNLTPIAKNGLDLYGWNNNHWQFIASTAASADTSEGIAIANLDGKLRHYKVNLPLYSSLTNLSVGVAEDAIIVPIEKSPKGNKLLSPTHKIVIYGSSITQGAAASRPGMAYPSILARQLPVETFNMGFSGSGKMELVMADIIGKMDADLYILDCVPNPTPKQIRDRAIPFIKRLHYLKPHTPILIMESIYRETANWNSKAKERMDEQNTAIREAFDQLQKEGIQNIYYLPCKDLMGDDHDATIDGTHLTDLGFMRLTKKLKEKIKTLFPDW